nr:MAG TPA: hypothetical protein [Caudoviricetes sp.]
MGTHPPSSLAPSVTSRSPSTLCNPNMTPKWTAAMISQSDAAIVRSLLRKTQALTLQLAEDAAAPRAKRMRATERAQKMRLTHCYITVAIRYMIETKA